MVDLIILIPLALIIGLFFVILWITYQKYKDRKAGIAVKDERTKMNEGKAAIITVLCTSYFTLALLWYVTFTGYIFPGLPEIETVWALILVSVFNAGLYLILKAYYNK